MIKKMKTEDLKVGMYVMLGQSWLRHSFMKPNFRITSEKQIKKILHDGIKEVKVDTSKSEVVKERDLFRDVLGPGGERKTEIEEPGKVKKAEIKEPSEEEKAEIKRPGREKKAEVKAPGKVKKTEIEEPGKVKKAEIKEPSEEEKAEIKRPGREKKAEVKAPGKVKKAEIEAPGKEKKAEVKGPGKEKKTKIEVPGTEDTPHTQGEVLPPNTQVHTKIPLPEEGEFSPMDAISEELHQTIQNTSIPPQTKAKAVYNHSLKMMTNVLDKPSAGNIMRGKKMVYDIVDHILVDNETADAMAQITSHDYYTYTHSVNVGVLSVLLSKTVFKGSYDHNMRELGAGFFLHDLGKCDVPQELINKAGGLNKEEWGIMRKHPSRGNRILSDTNQLTKECGLIVMQHHEREDGSGYPFGLVKDEIHIYARICAIADVYDALTSTRAYKKKLPVFEALEVMKEEMIHYFNRDLFESFILLFTG